jgi:hypothetical protein
VNPILETALEVQGFCRARAWRFCIIGGLAVQRWGEPRLTQDIDVTVISGFGSEEEFVDSLLSGFRGRIPDARAFALRHRVVLLESDAAVPIDVALGGIPFEERIVDRASGFDVGGSEPLLTCSAEDLVVLKAFAGRDKDWMDVEGIVTRQGRRLDAALVLSELEPLLELKDDILSLPRLRAILDRCDSEG